MKRFLIWTGWILAVLLVLFFGVIVAGTFYARKVAPWPDPVPGVSLKPSRPFLAASNIGPDNAYFYFLQLTNYAAAFDWSDTTKREFKRAQSNEWTNKGDEYPNLDKWIATNTELFRIYEHAALMTNSQAPTAISYSDDVTEMAYALKLAQLLHYRTVDDIRNARSASAASNIEIIIRNSAHLEKGAFHMGRLIAIAAAMNGSAALRTYAESGLMNHDDNERMSQLIQWRIREREPTSEGMKYEALLASNSIPSFLADSMPDAHVREGLGPIVNLLSHFTSSRSRTEKHIGSVYTHVIWADEDLQRAQVATQTLGLLLTNPVRKVLIFDDPLGLLLVNLVVPNFEKSAQNSLRCLGHYEATLAILAAESWRMDHDDKPPAKLANLCPKYLAKIPEDPFAKGSNLLYRVDADSYTIYSVGKDGLDGGGNVEGTDSPDVGWRVRLDRTAKKE